MVALFKSGVPNDLVSQTNFYELKFGFKKKKVKYDKVVEDFDTLTEFLVPLFKPNNAQKLGPVYLLLLNLNKETMEEIAEQISSEVGDDSNPHNVSIFTKSSEFDTKMESTVNQTKAKAFQAADVEMLEEQKVSDDRVMHKSIADKDLTIISIDSDELMSYICCYLTDRLK